MTTKTIITTIGMTTTETTRIITTRIATIGMTIETITKTFS